jgi:hypothetical protein
MQVLGTAIDPLKDRNQRQQSLSKQSTYINKNCHKYIRKAVDEALKQQKLSKK